MGGTASTSLRAIGLIVLGFLPVAIVGILWPNANSLVAALGSLCGLQAVLFSPRVRQGAALTGLMVVSVFVATLVASSPALGALWMVVVAAGAAVAARRGLMPGYGVVGIVTGFVMVSPESVDSALRIAVTPAVDTDLGLALDNAGLAALAGGWAVLVAALLLPRGFGPEPRPLDRRSATLLAVALALTTGAGTLVVLEWYRVPLAAWMLLTLYVLAMFPDPDDTSKATLRKAGQRVVGTFAGVAIAVAIARAVPATDVLHALGLVSLIASVAFAFDTDPRHYWRFVLFLTPAMVFLDSDAGTAVRAGELRLAFTAAGALGATAVVAVITFVANRVISDPAASGPPPERAQERARAV